MVTLDELEKDHTYWARTNSGEIITVTYDGVNLLDMTPENNIIDLATIQALDYNHNEEE